MGLIVLFLLLALLAIAGIRLFILDSSPPYDRGPVNDAVLRTLAQGGPVKDDLIMRGLFTIPTVDEAGAIVPGTIKVGEIEKLVKARVYSIDKQGYLTFGPNYNSP